MDTGVDLTDSKLYDCESCAANKLKARPHGEGHPANTIGERVSFDLVYPITPMSYDGSKGHISRANHKSRDIEIKLIKTKDEAADYVIHQDAEMQRQYNALIKHMHSDNGGEFVNSKLQRYMGEKGIIWENIVPYTPKQNGLTEICQHHLHISTATMLTEQNLPKFLWPMGLKQAV